MINDDLVEKALRALFKHENKQKLQKSRTTLIEGHSKPILVQIQLKSAVSKSVIVPVRIAIPFSIFDSNKEEHTICLFCKSADVTEIEEHISQNPIDGLVKIISLDQLKKNYRSFEDKRQLLKQHTHFVCDMRILSHVNNLLGKTFSARNDLPVPVDLENINKMEANINKSVHQSTYMPLKGQNITIRFGHTGMAEDHVKTNIIAGLEVAFSKIFPGKSKGKELDGVHSVHIKTSDSPALPVYAPTNSQIAEYFKRQISTSDERDAAAPSRKKNSKESKNTDSAPKTNKGKKGKN